MEVEEVVGFGIKRELKKVEAELKGFEDSRKRLIQAKKEGRYVVKFGEKMQVIARDHRKLEARQKELEAELLRERMVARYVEGPLRPTEKFALKTLERHGRYNRRVLEELWNFWADRVGD